MKTWPRLIPTVLLANGDMVKTIKFKKPNYLGDPINGVKIFNEKYVDELCILDICASRNSKSPDFDLLENIAMQAFMPLSYGGGITSIEQIRKLFYIGYEKVILNTEFIKNPDIIRDASSRFGAQSIIVSIDAKRKINDKYYCKTCDGKKKVSIAPEELARRAERLGAGEILLNSIDNDGIMQGYDVELIRRVSDAVSIPVIACGGARNIHDMDIILNTTNASAAAAGSMYVYYGEEKAILINAPTEDMIKKIGRKE